MLPPTIDDAEARGIRPLDAGRTALEERRWRAAATCFREALARVETPEAWEGLSWAAWWLDDAITVFDARARAHRLYRRRDRPGDAARLAVWLAADHIDFHGASAIARGWLERARRLLEPLEPGPGHGWLAFHEGYLASLSGDTDAALERADRAAELGRAGGVPDLEMLGLALRGSLLVSRGQVEPGVRLLDEATTVALEGEATVPISAAWTCCFLVSACESMRDYGRAFEWCDRIHDFARLFGSRYMLAFCRAHYGTVHRWRGEWDEAEAQLVAAIEDFRRSRPAFVDGPRLALAELRRLQGRGAEAEALLDGSSASSAHLCRARLALERGRPADAADLCERLLRREGSGHALARLPALELLVRIHAAGSSPRRARQALDELRRIAGAVGTAPLRAAVHQAEGLLAAAGGDAEHARRLFEDAVDLFERNPAPYETARARLDLADALLALGRVEAARREAGSALAVFEKLGAGHDAERARAYLHPGARCPERTPEGLPGGLTRREREVLRLIAEGLTNREIAGRLVISEHTVHRHVSNILGKLHVTSRTAAATRAARAGLLIATE